MQTENKDNSIFYQEISPLQISTWKKEILAPNTPINNIGGIMIITGAIDLDKFVKSIETTLENNDVFYMKLKEGSRIPKVYSDTNYFNIEIYKRNNINSQKVLEHDINETFNIYKDYLYRIRLYCSASKIVLSIVAHHLLFDGWSIGLIQQLVIKYFEGLPVKSKSSYYEVLNKRYNSVREYHINRCHTFWEKEITLIDNEYNKNASYFIFTKFNEMEIQKEIFDKLKFVLKAKGYSLTSFILSIVALFLQDKRQESNLIINLPLHNRRGNLEKATIGMFVSVIPLIIDLSKTNDFDDFIKIINQKIQLLYRYSTISFNEICSLAYECSNISLNDMVDVSVNIYGHTYSSSLGQYKVKIEEAKSHVQYYALQVILDNSTELNAIKFYYDGNNYTDHDIERLCMFFDDYINVYTDDYVIES